MKRYGKLWETLIRWENLVQAARKARRGSWHDVALHCRVANRNRNNPDNRNNNIGFRVCRP